MPLTTRKCACAFPDFCLITLDGEQRHRSMLGPTYIWEPLDEFVSIACYACIADKMAQFLLRKTRLAIRQAVRDVLKHGTTK